MAIMEGPHWDVGRMLKGTAERGKLKNYKTRPKVWGKQKLENVAMNDTDTIAELEAVWAKLLKKR